MRHILFIFFTFSLLAFQSCSNEPEQMVISTDMGDITVQLYNSTPKHRDNFVKLVEESYYDGTLFHRVVQGFMIQGGDPDSKKATPESLLGNGGPGYNLKPEFKEVHTRGALAAARLGDNMNPEKESSGCQFFIVQGGPVTEGMLVLEETNKKFKYTEAQKEKYLKNGGVPFLDQNYTVFGEVISGMDVVDKIAAEERGVADRPKKDIKIISIKKVK
ncbi:MAG: peptidylprolyl isomerase [Saprospiraceae bacterium]|nr:peptidylprolyl isomerase [Saprospiraceae bacterium]